MDEIDETLWQFVEKKVNGRIEFFLVGYKHIVHFRQVFFKSHQYIFHLPHENACIP